jgi:excisionase family DNA binding protein
MILNNNGMAMEKNILDVEEALEFLKTSKPTFYRWLKAGMIQGFKAGKQWRFYKKDLVAFMESTGTDFVLLKNEFKEAISFFEERLRSKGIVLKPMK